MRSRTTVILQWASLSAMMGVAASARAATLFMTGVSPSVAVNLTFPVVGAQSNVDVGPINWTFDRNLASNQQLNGYSSSGTGAIGTLQSFCIEGTQAVYAGRNTTFASILTDLSLAPQDKSGSAFQMGAQHAADLQKFWDAYYDPNWASQVGGDVSGAAFQLGIWEIVYDGAASGDLTNGQFTASAVAGNTASSAAVAQAQSWLTGLANLTPTASYNLAVLSDPRYQDQVFDPVPVPLPAALPAGAALLAGLAVVAKLRRR